MGWGTCLYGHALQPIRQHRPIFSQFLKRYPMAWGISFLLYPQCFPGNTLAGYPSRSCSPPSLIPIHLHHTVGNVPSFSPFLTLCSLGTTLHRPCIVLPIDAHSNPEIYKEKNIPAFDKAKCPFPSQRWVKELLFTVANPRFSAPTWTALGPSFFHVIIPFFVLQRLPASRMQTK